MEIKYKLQSVSKDIGWQHNELAYIPISLQNKYHYGQRFAHLLDWTAKRHSKIVINISDSLYRHNFISQRSQKNIAYSKALNSGQEWLLAHHFLLDGYNIVKIHRWDDWLNHPDYLELHKKILYLYESDNNFQKHIETDITNFTSRKIRRTKANHHRSIESSRNFLLEECACYILIGRRYRANRIYPGSSGNWFLYLQNSDIPEALQGCGNLSNIHIKFKRVRP